MFESIRKSIEKQNKLLEEILEKGSLESVLKDANPIETSATSLYMDPYNYDETRRCWEDIDNFIKRYEEEHKK